MSECYTFSPVSGQSLSYPSMGMYVLPCKNNGIGSVSYIFLSYLRCGWCGMLPQSLALEDLQLRGMLLLFDAISIARAREK
jgi:hypothetical protein